MARIKTSKWDPADYILTEEDVIATLAVAFEDGDAKEIASVLGDIARSKGMAAIAERTGKSREALYRTLSEAGNPRLDTFIGVMKALGLGIKPYALPRVA